MNNATATIKQLIRDMNETWMSGRMDDLECYFADSVVLVPPAEGERLIGKEQVLDSFRQYAEQAKTHAFEELDLQVDVIDSTAVVKLNFRVRYEYMGQVYEEKGLDILVLTCQAERWRIVWRTQLSQAIDDAA